jgi:hypothetical protein
VFVAAGRAALASDAPVFTRSRDGFATGLLVRIYEPCTVYSHTMYSRLSTLSGRVSTKEDEAGRYVDYPPYIASSAEALGSSCWTALPVSPPNGCLLTRHRNFQTDAGEPRPVKSGHPGLLL